MRQILERARKGEEELAAFLVDLVRIPSPLRQGRAGHRSASPKRCAGSASTRSASTGWATSSAASAAGRASSPSTPTSTPSTAGRPGPMVVRSLRAARRRRQGLGPRRRRPEGRPGRHGLRRAHHQRAGPGPRASPSLHRHRAGRGLRRHGLAVPGRGGEASGPSSSSSPSRPT